MRLVFLSFILGLGIGAEYPLAAASSAEGATDETRGQQLSLVFSLQGLGNVTAGLAGLIVISSFENSAPYSRDNLQDCWRILFAIGTFPALFGVPSKKQIRTIFTS